MTCEIELFGLEESVIALRYDEKSASHLGKKFGIVIEDAFLTIQRLKPTDQCRIKYNSVLKTGFHYPIVLVKLYGTYLNLLVVR